MSTNKTQNYNLHSWLPDDDFQLSEINENFAAIDGVLSALPQKLEAVVGFYVGNGEENRHIELGRRPFAVHVEMSNGIRGGNEYSTLGGLAFGESGIGRYLIIDDTGFTLYADSYGRLNASNRKYYYMAFFEG